MRIGFWGSLPLIVSCLGLVGCASIAAGSTIRVIDGAAPALGRFEDPQLAEDAIPGSIATMEGVLILKPDNLTLRRSIARAYSSLGFGFLVNHMEDAYANDDEALAETYRVRASLAFKRARTVVLEGMTAENDEGGGALEQKKRGIEAWKKYVATFDDEDLAELLFWGAYSWAQYISLNQNDADAMADREFAAALLEHVIKLDGSVQNYAPYALRGGLLSAVPAQVGGKPDEGAKQFDVAIEHTNRQMYMYMVMKARFVAVALQDRAMYKSLLDEVIAGDPDVVLDQRLSNRLAKLRAERYLAQIDDLFMPEEQGEPAVDAAAPEAGAAATPAAATPAAAAPAAAPASAKKPASDSKPR